MPRCIKEKSGKQEKNRTMHFICLMCGAARWMKGGDFLKTTKLSEGRRSTWQKFQHHTSASISGAKWWWHIGRHVITPQLCASLRIVGILILRTNILMLYQPLAQCFSCTSTCIPNLVTVHCVGFNLNHTWPSHLTYLPDLPREAPIKKIRIKMGMSPNSNLTARPGIPGRPGMPGIPGIPGERAPL